MNNKYVKMVCAFIVIMGVYTAVQANVDIAEEGQCLCRPEGDDVDIIQGSDDIRSSMRNWPLPSEKNRTVK